MALATLADITYPITTLADVHVHVDPSDGVELVGVADAAKLMGVSARAVYFWIAARRVEVRRTASGRMRVVVASLMRESPAVG